MFRDIIEAYADAIYVATTLRPPVSASPAPGGQRSGECVERRRSRVSRRLASWFRTSLGRRLDATAATTAPIPPSFLGARHP